MRIDEPERETAATDTAATTEPKKRLVIRKDIVAALRVRSGLRAGVLLDGQPQVDGSEGR